MIEINNPSNRTKIQQQVIKMSTIIKKKGKMKTENSNNLKIITEIVRENYHQNLSHPIVQVLNHEFLVYKLKR